jgi:hypothetical protein
MKEGWENVKIAAHAACFYTNVPSCDLKTIILTEPFAQFIASDRPCAGNIQGLDPNRRINRADTILLSFLKKKLFSSKSLLKKEVKSWG